ncbi:PTS galactitol transporter subunit IIC [Absicoccus porci]|uniref:PTS galactitol transporter subunit IIC n=1 Tax=Absicoccus porci TaxID=2486576 RepID=A0A3N0HYM0_9FIRM|nr:PTS transporter subunit IIC [Absicoccus porci]RNM29436.1 PTS galactitol transporter subunit IIC [Absicoccus porci]
MAVLNYILGMGSSVVMPIIITVLGLILGEKFSKAFRAGLTIGIGFIGINLVVGLMGQYITPATQAMVARFGLNLEVIDVGWPVSSSIAFATNIVPFVFITCFVINIIMLAFNWTKTLDIDIWNYWHFILTGSLIQYMTGSMIWGIIGSGITFIIIVKFADMTAPLVQDYFGLPGISLPHTETVSWAPIFILLDKVYDKIPGLRSVNLDGEAISEKLGFLGEPMILGVILGAAIGVMAGEDLAGVVTIAVNMAAVMFILPRMVSILMEGLMPLSEDAKNFMNKRFPGKEVYIGLDAAVATGSPMVISSALIMIPITLLLSFILPGNKVMPLVDFSTIPFFMIWPVVASKGNLLRALISGTLMMICILYIATDLAPTVTTIAKSVDFAFPEGAKYVSSLDIGAHLVPYVIAKIISIFA